MGFFCADIVDFSIFKDLVWASVFSLNDCLNNFIFKCSLCKSLLKIFHQSQSYFLLSKYSDAPQVWQHQGMVWKVQKDFIFPLPFYSAAHDHWYFQKTSSDVLCLTGLPVRKPRLAEWNNFVGLSTLTKAFGRRVQVYWKLITFLSQISTLFEENILLGSEIYVLRLRIS